MDRTVHWRFTWRRSRLVRWTATVAGGAGLGLVVAALLARAGTPLTAASAVFAIGTLLAAWTAMRFERRGRVRAAASARVAAAAPPVALLLYGLAMQSSLVAVLSVVGALQVALAAGTLAAGLRSVGTVDPDAKILSYGTPDSQVTVDLDDAAGAYALRFRRRGLLVLTWRDRRVLDPSAPSLVVVSRDGAALARRIVRS